jgi:hypothetical protein
MGKIDNDECKKEGYVEYAKIEHCECERFEN